MPEISAKSKLNIEIGAEVAQAELGLRSLSKLMADFRKEAEKQGKVSFLPNVELLKEQVRAGLKPVQDLQRQLGQTIKQAKIDIAGSTDQAEIERLQLLIAKTTTSLKQLGQTQKQLKADAASSAKATFLDNLALQAKAGVIPLSRLRDELVKTVRAKIGALSNRSDFVNDPEILRDILQVKQLNAEIDKVRQNVAQPVKNPFVGFGQALQNALLPLAGLAAGLTLAFQQAGTAAHEFDTQLRLISTITKQTGPEVQALGDKIQKAAQELQTNPVELAAAQYEILSSGVEDAAQAFEVMTVSAKLAKAGVGTAAEAADLLTSSLNALGGTPARNAEVLFKAVELGKVKISELGQEFGGVASQAAIAGVSLEELSASVATLSLTGRNPAEGLTGIRAVLTAVSKQAPEAVKFAKAIGLEFNTAAIRAKGFAGFIADVAKQTKGSDEAIAKLFGRVEGINTVLSLGTVQAGQYAEILDKVKNSTGSLDEAFQRTLNPIDGFLTALKSVSIEVGEKLTTALAKPLGQLTQLMGLFADNKDLIAFATGAGGVALALTGLATAASAATFVLRPLLALFPLLAGALGIGVAPTALAVVAALTALAATGGLLVQWANQADESTKLAQRSLSQLNAEVDQATAGIVNEGREAIKTAKSFDELAKKTNKTQAEKDRLKQTIIDLSKKFPELLSQVDQLTAGYGSLTDKIKGATAAKLAFLESQSIEKELERVRQEQQKILGGFTFNRDAKGGKILSADEAKRLKSYQAQQKDLLTRQENLPQTISSKLKAVLNPVETTKALPPGGSLHVPDESEINKIKNAREQLTKQIDKIEEEHTGFLKGEFAKRKLEAAHAFEEQQRQIKELAKTAGKSGSPEVLQALNDAKSNYAKTLQQINREETKAQQENNRVIQELRQSINSANAAITLDNPFDDLRAESKKAEEEIKKNSQLVFQALDEQARKNPAFKGVIDQIKALKAQETQILLAGNENALRQRQFEEGRALLDLQQQNKVMQEEIAGDTLKIEQATNARIIADLQVRIDNQKKILENATIALQKNPKNPDLVLGQNKAVADLENLKLEQQKQQEASIRKQANIQSDAVQQVVGQLQQEIDLYGKRPELVQKLLAAYSEYIKTLEKERDITTQTVEARNQINGLIQQAQASATQLHTSTDSTAQAIDALQNLNLGSGDFSSLFKNILSGISQVRTAFKTLNSDTSKAKVSFKNFLSGNQDAKNSLAALGSQAAQVIGDHFSQGKDGLAKSIGTTLSGVFASLSSGPAAPFALALNSASQAFQGSGSFFSKYVKFIDPLGFRKLFGADTKSAVEKAQENLEKTQKFMQDILGKTDQNDLNSLTKALNQINKFTSGGGQAFAAKKDAATQIKAAIKNRKQVIEDAIKDLKFQNGAIQKEFAKFDDVPLQNLDIDRELQLDQLTNERDKALAQFKDSLVVQQEIQTNFELKRQAILKQSSLDIIDAIIEEQNTIRTLRAQDAVNQAKISGNAIEQINAELQSRLVALDNDIASFKGAEETKTEFLKEKVSERNALIKDANDQVDDLLQQGLDILNEGLVVGQSKEQSQQKRLQKLFGSLNPLGLIQADGNLVQSNVTVGAGAIQMNFEGIQDPQSLIAQLLDPIIQNKLLAALNAALARG